MLFQTRTPKTEESQGLFQIATNVDNNSDSIGSHHELIEMKGTSNNTDEAPSTSSTNMTSSYQKLDTTDGMVTSDSDTLTESCRSNVPLLGHRTGNGYSIIKDLSDDKDIDVNCNNQSLQTSKSMPDFKNSSNVEPTKQIYVTPSVTNQEYCNNKVKVPTMLVQNTHLQQPHTSDNNKEGNVVLNNHINYEPTFLENQINGIEISRENHVLNDVSLIPTAVHQNETSRDSLTLSDDFLNGNDTEQDLASDWDEILTLCNSFPDFSAKNMRDMKESNV